MFTSRFTVTQLYTYPIKSLGGVALSQANITKTGFQYDREWILVDENGVMVTQREYTELALFKVSILADSLHVQYKDDAIDIPIHYKAGRSVKVLVWHTYASGVIQSDEINRWFSKQLGKTVYLLRKDREIRMVRRHDGHEIAFADGHQYLIAGQSAMDDLNHRLGQHYNINRFRANIIFEGGEAYADDTWHQFNIGNTTFEVTKPCMRCPVVNIDQDTATSTKDTLKTLSNYRRKANKVMFGQNLKCLNPMDQVIRIGDNISISSTKDSPFIKGS